MNKGRIIKALSGFYYIDSPEGIIECRARGVFRKEGTAPLVGDNTEYEITGEGKGIICGILPRKNSLIRPPVANIDKLFIVVSTTNPLPNLFLIDRIIAIAEDKDIEPVILINKTDLKSGEDIRELYSNAGFVCKCVCAANGEGMDDIKQLIKDSVCAFTGNSGVGKSSLLNAISPELGLQTNEISQKLGRGKHTTRFVSLYQCCGGYIADTPGFSSFDVKQCDIIRKENLQYCFREFEPFLNKCKFTSCSHTKEKGCAVLQAVENGAVAPSRHSSYFQLYSQASLIHDWELEN